MGKPFCVIEGKYFTYQKKKYPVTHDNYIRLGADESKIGNEVCQKCYFQKCHLIQKERKRYLREGETGGNKNQQQIHFPRIECDWMMHNTCGSFWFL